jgi:hypothetical protein
MTSLVERVLKGKPCAHTAPCKNFARVGRDTCRWHDPEVLEARKAVEKADREAEKARQRLLRAAGAA